MKVNQTFKRSKRKEKMKMNERQYPVTPQISPMPQIPIMAPTPMAPQMPALTPQYLIARLRPQVRYGLREAQYTSVRHAMYQIVMIAYLMGMGHDLLRAHEIVEHWEIDEMFHGERI